MSAGGGGEEHDVYAHLTLKKALARTETWPWAQWFARMLGVVLVLLVIGFMVTPWQQNIRGVGRVVAYVPAERQQVISTPVEGRVSRWYIREGAVVKAGDVLAEVADNDPFLLQRLYAEQQTLLARKIAVDHRVQTQQEQLLMAEQARPQALNAAKSRVEMAKERKLAAEQSVIAGQAAQKTAALNLSRQQILRDKGLASVRTFELSELEMAQRDTELGRAKAVFQASASEVAAFQADADRLAADTAASVQKAQAELSKAIEEQNYVKADLLKLQTSMARQQNQVVVSPKNGTVLRLLANPGAELLKPGQALAVLVPDTDQRAVELWVDGNDLPLIVTYSRVRLQFEGYPAIQFAGWPELSIGSFGGRVVLIDATDDGMGRFRVVVTPDPDDIPWPEVRFLRQGVRANGWVLLGRVTLGYELWRIFNGFPPLILPEPRLSDISKDGSKQSGMEEGKY